MASPEDGAAGAWVLSRIDRWCRDGAATMLRECAEYLAVATGAAVTVRVLSVDGTELLPVLAHHPDPGRGDAIARVMGETTQSATTGLWRAVVAERQARRWATPPGAPPAEASDAQVAFLDEHPVRAVVGAPLLLDGRVVGGLALVRFTVDRPFTAADEQLLTDAGRWIAPVLDLQRRLALLEVPAV